LLCTNTMHRIAEPLAARLDTPLIHIVDETAAAIASAALRRPILLGTRFTMSETFYRRRLERFGFEAAAVAFALDEPTVKRTSVG
jgi:aspartate racemase